MIDSPRWLGLAALVPLLGGCVGTIARTAVDVASAGVDAATTSQAEADQKRGRELRRAEEERGRQLRLMEERCRKGKALPTDTCAAVVR